MDHKFVNPFIEATVNVLSTMTQTEPVAGTPYRKDGIKSWGVVSGIIGMGGDQLTGNMILSFEAPTILTIVSRMLLEDYTEINKDVIDAVGEITNMIAGNASRIFSELGYKFEMASPMMLHGSNIEINRLSSNPITVIPFSTDAGNFVLEANLAPR